MRKLFAISLLVIHLFNIAGQLALHEYMVYKSDSFFARQVNKNLYNVEDLTEIKIPIDMPAISDWKNYQKLSGQVQFQNASYNYVKMRITHNAIYLMCVPNYATTHYATQNIIYAKQIKDIPVPKKDHVPFGKVNVMVYNHQAVNYKFATPVTVLTKIIYSNRSIIIDAFITGPGQPPDMPTLLS